MTKSIPLDDPRKAKNADKWDGMTVDSFMRDTLWTQSKFDEILGVDLEEGVWVQYQYLFLWLHLTLIACTCSSS